MPDGMLPSAALVRRRITIGGTVQGVGFRPHAFRLATDLALAGYIRNTQGGVEIEIEGPLDRVEVFAARLLAEAPAPSRIACMEQQPLPAAGEDGFVIAMSGHSAGYGVTVPPDAALCAECRSDVLARGSRHHGYALTACAQCGPRFSVVAEMPYDRANTTLAAFALCAACGADYANPASRRFHAETQACPVCGPQLALHGPDGSVIAVGPDCIERVAACLRAGGIAAVKGIGGFHLLARADDAHAVATLRARKQRPMQPFAVMFPDAANAAYWCEMATAEAGTLTSAAAPIVLLRRSANCGAADGVAPGNARLGAMLPYTPLHHLLMAALPLPLVVTSANLSGSALIFEMCDELYSLAGLVLTHDRPILRPVEDSVVQYVGSTLVTLRLGRGYAPLSIKLASAPPPLLALGGHLKNAPAISLGDTALLGPQLGDLDNAGTLAAHHALTAGLCRLHGVTPQSVVCDAHPDDMAEATRHRLPIIGVPHHLAHVAAVMAEHKLQGPVLGLAWDGAGYGPDGTVWGGEFLLVDGAQWQRVAHLRRFRLPGGDMAAREPTRAAAGALAEVFGPGLQDWPAHAIERLSDPRLPALLALCRAGLAAPLTSSAGRLFDAVSALLGLCQRNSFESEAAIALEQAAADERGRFAFSLTGTGPIVIDWAPALAALLGALNIGVPRAAVASRFYQGLAEAAAMVAKHVGVPDVALTGGCFQSPLLIARLSETLTAAGLRVHLPHKVPPGDGGLALGQIEWARRVLAAGS